MTADMRLEHVRNKAQAAIRSTQPELRRIADTYKLTGLDPQDHDRVMLCVRWCLGEMGRDDMHRQDLENG
jgi:hypothetical protein